MPVEQIRTLWPKVALAVGAIHKEQKNVQQRYSFRGIDDVMKALHKPLFDNGLTISSDIISWDARDLTRQGQKGEQQISEVFVQMRYTVMAPDNSFITADALGQSIDYQDKAANQAMSQAFKMAMLQLLVSPTDDVDPEALTPRPPAGAPATAKAEPAPVEDSWEVKAKKEAMSLVGGEGNEAKAAVLFGNALGELGQEAAEITTATKHNALVKKMKALVEADNG